MIGYFVDIEIPLRAADTDSRNMESTRPTVSNKVAKFRNPELSGGTAKM